MVNVNGFVLSSYAEIARYLQQTVHIDCKDSETNW